MKAVIGGLLVIIVLGALGGALYYFWPQPNGKATFAFVPPEEDVYSGQPFVIRVRYTNESETPLTNARIAVNLPAGVVLVGNAGDVRVAERALDVIPPFEKGEAEFRLIAVNGGQAIRRIEGGLSYVLDADSRARYEARDGFDLLVSQPAITLSVMTPEKVFSGEQFEAVITYENTSPAAIREPHITLKQPNNFTIIKSVPSSTGPAGGTWTLPELPPGGRGTITVTGVISAAAETYFGLESTASAVYSGIEYLVATQQGNIAIAPSPLALSIALNDSGMKTTVRPGDNLNIELSYQNNTAVTLENVNVRMSIAGEMVEYSRIRSPGFFDSVRSVFTWSPANTSALKSVLPNTGGTITVQVPLKSSYPVRRASDSNFVIKLDGVVETTTIPPGLVAEKIRSVASAEAKVGGTLNLTAWGMFRDPVSGITNIGPYPPRVNQPTQYTIHWKMTTMAAPMAHVRVSTYLQSNTRFTGKASTSIGALNYNSASGEVVWDVGTLEANQGLFGPAPEAVFQIENTPAVNQVDQLVPLSARVSFEGDDQHAGVPYRGDAREITTEIPLDKSIVTSDRVVRE